MKYKNYNKGQTIITVIIFFVFISLAVITGSFVVTTRESRLARDMIISQKSYFLAESGIEDLAYRIMNLKYYNSPETLFLDGAYATTTVINLPSNEKEITSTSTISNFIRKTKMKIISGSTVSFFYGVQSGAGGMEIGNGSSFSGSLYSNGEIDGSGNMVYGTVVSAGPNGEIDDIHATSSAYAHNIENSIIDKDTYYQDIINTIVGGTSHPGSPDQPLLPMPVSDSMIQDWENSAAVNVISECSGGNLTISSARTLGPAKIPCNLTLNSTLTLTGPIWVEGDISLGNSTIKIDPSLGGGSVALIADKTSDRLNGSTVTMTNGAIFIGSGSSLSYVFLISMNNSAENNEDVIAIDVNNNLNGDLFAYAPHGLIDIKNGANLTGMAGYEINIKNNAVITYEIGLASLLFESGPGEGYSISQWKESQ